MGPSVCHTWHSCFLPASMRSFVSSCCSTWRNCLKLLFWPIKVTLHAGHWCHLLRYSVQIWASSSSCLDCHVPVLIFCHSMHRTVKKRKNWMLKFWSQTYLRPDDGRIKCRLYSEISWKFKCLSLLCVLWVTYIYDFSHFSLTVLVNCNQLSDLKG